MLTVLHAGGKFDHNSYKVSGGLHGVGVSCVNALSEWLEVEVKRDGFVHHMRFETGKAVTQVEKIGKCKGTGTKVTFCLVDVKHYGETGVFKKDYPRTYFECNGDLQGIAGRAMQDIESLDAIVDAQGSAK